MRLLCAASALLLLPACGSSQSDDSGARPETSYFPLAVGTSWIYRCVEEGGVASGGWSAEVTGVQSTERGLVYTVREIPSGAGEPADVRYLATPDGKYFAIPKGGTEASVSAADLPEAAVRMSVGEEYAAGKANEVVDYELASGRVIEALRVENGVSPDDGGDESWTAKYYAIGLGLVGTANGLGGGCDLASFGAPESP